MSIDATLTDAPLGKTATYHDHYNPDLLFPIARRAKRDEIAVPRTLPFQGYDIWNAYEISCLNLKGKPQVAIGEFIIPCESRHLIESKSFKLYLNSFNQTKLADLQQLQHTMQKDLTAACQADITVKLVPASDFALSQFKEFSGICLDDLDVDCNCYQVQSDFLSTTSQSCDETIYSNLLKSNCLVTGQPDWASIMIHYRGKQINHAGLLRYLVSYRQHNEFHEQCVERIFMDIQRRCRPQKLTVYARYSRRGGLDINPLRSNEDLSFNNFRLARQ